VALDSAAAAVMSTSTASSKSAKNQKRKQSRSKQSSKPKQDVTVQDPLHPDTRLLVRGGLMSAQEADSLDGNPPPSGAVLQKIFLQVCHKGHEPEQAATVLHALWEAGLAYDNADAVIEQLALQREVAAKCPPSPSPVAVHEATADTASTATVTAVSDEPEATHPAVEASTDAQVSPRNSSAAAAAADSVFEEPSMGSRLETAGAHPIVADALMSITQWAASQSQQQLAVLFQCKALDQLFQVRLCAPTCTRYCTSAAQLPLAHCKRCQYRNELMHSTSVCHALALITNALQNILINAAAQDFDSVVYPPLCTFLDTALPAATAGDASNTAAAAARGTMLASVVATLREAARVEMPVSGTTVLAQCAADAVKRYYFAAVEAAGSSSSTAAAAAAFDQLALEVSLLLTLHCGSAS
jgi:hypothetical protein